MDALLALTALALTSGTGLLAARHWVRNDGYGRSPTPAPREWSTSNLPSHPYASRC